MVSCMDYITVPSEISKELYNKIRKYSMSISDIIRRSLGKEARKSEEKKIKKSLNDASRILRKIPAEEIANAIRLSREER